MFSSFWDISTSMRAYISLVPVSMEKLPLLVFLSSDIFGVVIISLISSFSGVGGDVLVTLMSSWYINGVVQSLVNLLHSSYIKLKSLLGSFCSLGCCVTKFPFLFEV